MLILKKSKILSTYLLQQKGAGKTIGFVPTMGALHEGHLSLVEQSKKDNGLTVCSIFVNPTQFNDPSDLQKYPRPVEKDIEMLIGLDTDVLFLPEVDEMYPRSTTEKAYFNFGHLEEVMEGEYRPGHFTGVAQIVTKLLDITIPDRLYLGQKDYQQCAILSAMVLQQQRNTKVVVCPTVREAGGLAMSSRNMLLSEQDRRDALLIYQTLLEIKNNFRKHSVTAVKEWAIDNLSSNSNVQPEYFEIADAETLKPISGWDESDKIVACAAARVGAVRLIDNMIIS